MAMYTMEPWPSMEPWSMSEELDLPSLGAVGSVKLSRGWLDAQCANPEGEELGTDMMANDLMSPMEDMRVSLSPGLRSSVYRLKSSPSKRECLAFVLRDLPNTHNIMLLAVDAQELVNVLADWLKDPGFFEKDFRTIGGLVDARDRIASQMLVRTVRKEGGLFAWPWFFGPKKLRFYTLLAHMKQAYDPSVFGQPEDIRRTLLSGESIPQARLTVDDDTEVTIEHKLTQKSSYDNVRKFVQESLSLVEKRFLQSQRVSEQLESVLSQY